LEWSENKVTTFFEWQKLCTYDFLFITALESIFCFFPAKTEYEKFGAQFTLVVKKEDELPRAVLHSEMQIFLENLQKIERTLELDKIIGETKLVSQVEQSIANVKSKIDFLWVHFEICFCNQIEWAHHGLIF